MTLGSIVLADSLTKRLTWREALDLALNLADVLSGHSSHSGEEPDLFCSFLNEANLLDDAIRRHVFDAVNDDVAEVVNEV